MNKAFIEREYLEKIACLGPLEQRLFSCLLKKKAEKVIPVKKQTGSDKLDLKVKLKLLDYFLDQKRKWSIRIVIVLLVILLLWLISFPDISTLKENFISVNLQILVLIIESTPKSRQIYFG